MKKLFLPVLLLVSCSRLSAQSNEDKTQLLCDWLTGTFNNSVQAKEDTAFFTIQLSIQPIWKTKAEGCWLYVEQAMANATEKPYRQRIYHVRRTGTSRYESVIYTLNDPLRFARKIEKVEALSKDSIQLKKGCEVILSWDETQQRFSGQTEKGTCPSDLRGAAYATSEVTLTDRLLLSLDRGYNAGHEQVWGSEKGGYAFLRQE